MPQVPPSAPHFAALPTEAEHPRSSRLDTMGAEGVVKLLLSEEVLAAQAVRGQARAVARGAKLVAERLAAGGRLVYVGAGTSGRLGTLDAVECVPTFGIPPSRVVPIIAGGPHALTRAVEGAEDDARDAEQRLRRAAVGPKDVVCCIAASGVTPFARAALEYARFRRAATIFVTCNPKTAEDPAVTELSDVLIAVPTGPEVVAGSTRLKAGTATKLVLNALSTTTFVLLGKTYGGLMVDVRPTNAKLWARAVRLVQRITGVDEEAARKLIEKAGGRAKVAMVMHHKQVTAARARELLLEHRGSLRALVGDLPGFAPNTKTDTPKGATKKTMKPSEKARAKPAPKPPTKVRAPKTNARASLVTAPEPGAATEDATTKTAAKTAPEPAPRKKRAAAAP